MKNQFVIAATHSGCGKTTITLGLLKALIDRGYDVQSFKCGPDFLDPILHEYVTNRPSNNLDTWMLDEVSNRKIFHKYASNCDISIIEGVMGTFDGSEGVGQKGSTADLAKLLSLPVLLVVDAQGMAGSIVPYIAGFLQWDSGIRYCGILLNRVGSESHGNLLKGLIEENLNVPVIGFLPKNPDITLPSRHLGLRTDYNVDVWSETIQLIANFIEKHVNIEELLQYTAVPQNSNTIQEELVTETIQYSINRLIKTEESHSDEKITIGIAKDEAFKFYYHENLELLKSSQINLVEFSPLNDWTLPDVDAIYIGGGYPEVYKEQLAHNAGFIKNLRDKINDGMPVFAECGGYMYLAEAIDGVPMVGVVPGKITMESRFQALGYVEALTASEGFMMQGIPIRGHEFHYSKLTSEIPADQQKPAFQYLGRKAGKISGYHSNHIFASYVHVHFLSNIDFVSSFVNAAYLYRNQLKQRQNSIENQLNIQVHTGNGKGKTTAAIGNVIARLPNKAGIVQFLKGSRDTGEKIVFYHLEQVDLFTCGTGKFIRNSNPTQDDYREAENGLLKANEFVKNPSYKTIVLDEISHTINKGLISITDILELIRLKSPETLLILTGRDMPNELMEVADCVMHYRQEKHPYEKNIQARRGIEY
ncbi:hypothetical protein BHU72_07975 [Desulfuribacillus stibiiarsenatis]|uniref:Cobyrinate a,c-diamide synthase n=1 Tax=Desulfuribacillus stibiiarsenatis TaxID=1390249 RepID=A0A1E5L3Q0_9FIRM|nr:cobyrinate a,c-diamide synthase [Desulfuribacillus stibiiarsenatis]OEH84762.1 hypothetical protein BHU72_07975 [Desulfuribacillus stibiiarsenatis]